MAVNTDETRGDLRTETRSGELVVITSGCWTLPHLGLLELAAAGVRPEPGAPVVFDATALVQMDTGGAWLLGRLRSRLTGGGHAVEIAGLAPEYGELLALVEKRVEPDAAVAKPPRQNLLERVGRITVAQALDLLALLAFIGESTVAFLRQVVKPRRVRWRMTLKIVQDSGLDALPIIGLLVFLLGIVVAYQGGRQLKIYGANIFVVEMVGLIMLRELAPLITAIIVAGRTGSAYAAEIGTMRVTEEIDALKTLGIGPFDQLVLPKVVGLMVALPLLTVFADALGVFGGMVMATHVLDVSFTDFIQRVPQAISTSDFVVGVAKAPVFALIIAMVGCHQGFQVSGGADSVGRQTTVSVVQSIFLVIISDAGFSILFSWLGV